MNRYDIIAVVNVILTFGLPVPLVYLFHLCVAPGMYIMDMIGLLAFIEISLWLIMLKPSVESIRWLNYGF